MICLILLLLPAAAFSSHQESAEYSEHLGLVPGCEGQMESACSSMLCSGKWEWHGAPLCKRYLETPARDLPTVSPCRGGIAFLGLPKVLSSMWLLSPPELLPGSCSKMEQIMPQWKKVQVWTVILCSVKESWPLPYQAHVSSWLSCAVRKSSCPMIYLVT